MAKLHLSTRARVAAVVGVVAASTIASAAAKTQPSAHAWAAKLPGCQVDRPAVAHYAGQLVLLHQPKDGPVPCGTSTGWPAVENKIEVTNNNTVIYEPALQGGPVLSGGGHVPGWGKAFGIASTHNAGGSWIGTSVPVYPDTYVEDGQVDNNIYVDHATGRFFWYMYNTGNAQIQGVCGNGRGGTVSYSSDNGNTWAHGFDFDHDCSENPDLLTGKPTRHGQTKGYPDVVYLCGDNASSGAAATGTSGFSCSKSLDGGATWLGTTFDNLTNPTTKPQGYYSGLGKNQLDPYPQCAGKPATAGANVQPLPSGTLVVLVACNGKYFLSESKDEGATWHLTNRIPHAGILRIDSVGNMYLAERVDTAPSSTNHARAGGSDRANADADQLKEAQDQDQGGLVNIGGNGAAILLSHSTDGGRSWSRELNITAPGVREVGTWTFAQGTYAKGMIGDVAVTYYGLNPQSPDGAKGYSDGFITQTRNALAAKPLFWSGQVNQPGDPLLYNTKTDGNIGITVLDFNGGALSPDGRSAWGSWVQDCGPNVSTSPGCTKRLPHINPGDPDEGFAGRLVWPNR